MAFWSVEERVGLESWHVLELHRLGDRFTIHYCATPGVVARPAHGKAEETIRCGHCGETVRFTVLCASRTRRWRAWLFWGGVALLGAAGGLGYVSYQRVGHAEGPFWPLVSAVVDALLFCTGVAGVTAGLVFPGIRSPNLWTGQPAQPGTHLGTYDVHPGRRRRRRQRVVSLHEHPAEPPASDDSTATLR